MVSIKILEKVSIDVEEVVEAYKKYVIRKNMPKEAFEFLMFNNNIEKIFISPFDNINYLTYRNKENKIVKVGLKVTRIKEPIILEKRRGPIKLVEYAIKNREYHFLYDIAKHFESLKIYPDVIDGGYISKVTWSDEVYSLRPTNIDKTLNICKNTSLEAIEENVQTIFALYMQDYSYNFIPMTSSKEKLEEALEVLSHNAYELGKKVNIKLNYYVSPNDLLARRLRVEETNGEIVVNLPIAQDAMSVVNKRYYDSWDLRKDFYARLNTIRLLELNEKRDVPVKDVLPLLKDLTGAEVKIIGKTEDIFHYFERIEDRIILVMSLKQGESQSWRNCIKVSSENYNSLIKELERDYS